MKKKCQKREREGERKTLMQHLEEISRDFSRRPFLFACLPQTSSSPFLSPFVHPFYPSFSRHCFPPYRRIMLLWPIVMLLNYICSQWGVIAIGAFDSRDSTNISHRHFQSVCVDCHFPLAVHVSHGHSCGHVSGKCVPLVYSSSFQIKYKSYLNRFLRHF